MVTKTDLLLLNENWNMSALPNIRFHDNVYSHSQDVTG
jgi:hypothetical protein